MTDLSLIMFAMCMFVWLMDIRLHKTIQKNLKEMQELLEESRKLAGEQP